MSLGNIWVDPFDDPSDDYGFDFAPDSDDFSEPEFSEDELWAILLWFSSNGYGTEENNTGSKH